MRAKTDGRNKTMLKIFQFSPDDAALGHRFFLTPNDLIRKSRTLRKKTCSDTTCNSQIVKIIPGLAGISIGKRPSNEPKTLQRPLFAGLYLSSPSPTSHKSRTLRKRVSPSFQQYQEHQNPTSGATSTVHAKTDKNKENVLKI
jgi:hypothetical protein